MAWRAIAVALCLLGLLPAAAAARTPPLRGAATHPLWSSSSVADFDQELDLLEDAGANSVRIDIGWSTLELAGKGQFDASYFQKADTFFEHARERGLKVIVTFWTTPCWASSAPPDVKQDCAGAWWDRGVERYPPTNAADFAAAAAWVADRWEQDIAALEVWNEPNYDFFFNTADPVGDYADLIKAAYPAVKAAAPGVKVIGPAMLNSDWEYLEGLYDLGVQFDGVSSRPFNQGRDPYDTSEPADRNYLTGVPRQREVMVAHGDGDKGLWFTELGWSSCAPGGVSVWCVSRDQQAQYIADAYRIVRDRWDFVEAFSVYTLRNTGTSLTDRESQMGMIDIGFQPKPSYDAFKAVLAEPPPKPPAPPPPAPTDPTPPARAQAVKLTLGPLALASRTLGPRWARRKLSFHLSRPARVTFSVQRARRGRWVKFGKPVVKKGKLGVNRVRLGALFAGKRPPAGRYRFSARARAGGSASKLRRISFSLEFRRP